MDPLSSVHVIIGHVEHGNLEEEMANHSSILAWEIPWTEEPGRLQSLGLHTKTGALQPLSLLLLLQVPTSSQFFFSLSVSF